MADKSYTYSQVIGNRLKMLKPAKAYVDFIGSPDKVNWPKGYVTAPVYSYIEKNGNLYWQIGSGIGATPRYIKHKQGLFKLIPDSGGAKYLENDSQDGSWFSLIRNSEGLGGTIQMGLEYAVIILAGIIVIKILEIF
jgi:hypothetical protein